MLENMVIDYIPAKECIEGAYCNCYKCGKCGRVFNDKGFMVDDGGTTTIECEEE